jgi:hypothetical protein
MELTAAMQATTVVARARNGIAGSPRFVRWTVPPEGNPGDANPESGAGITGTAKEAWDAS